MSPGRGILSCSRVAGTSPLNPDFTSTSAPVGNHSPPPGLPLSTGPIRMPSKSSLPLLCLIASALRAAPAMAQVTVSPMVVERPVESVSVANAGPVAVRLESAVGDFEQNPDGSHRIVPVGESPHTCGSRLHLGTVPTQVAPAQEARISVRVDPGDSACWSALLLHVSDGNGHGGTFIVKVYSVPAGVAPDVQLVGLAVTTTELRLDVRNNGSVPVRPRGRLEVRTTTGAVVAVQEIPSFGVHPGDRRALRLPLSIQLPAGRYVALAVLDAGGQDLLAGQTTLDIAGAAGGR